MKNAILSGGTLVTVALSLAVSACASQSSSASRTPTAAATNADGERRAEQADRETTIQISEDVRKSCKMDDLPATAPRFDYDRTTLHAYGRNVLDDVANCLRDGPLSDQVVTLVGRADPRGTESYNDALGASRAAAARDYLTQRGVPAGRIRLVSRGEYGATGNDEASYARDRRVDIELGDVSHHPIVEGTMKQIQTSRARLPAHPEAASYADTAEGGKPVSGASGEGVSSESIPSGDVKGSASGSVQVGTGSK